jgi:hypothetical protein
MIATIRIINHPFEVQPYKNINICRAFICCDESLEFNTRGIDTKNFIRSHGANKADECFRVCSVEMQGVNSKDGTADCKSNWPSRFRIPDSQVRSMRT